MSEGDTIKMRMRTFATLAVIAATTLTASNAHAANISWQGSLNSAMATAKKTNKPVFLYFSTEWCGPCKVMKQTTFKDSKVVAESRKWVMVQVDAEKQEAIASKYKIDTYPTMLILKPNGTTVSRVEASAKTAGVLKTNGFLSWLKTQYPKAKQ